MADTKNNYFKGLGRFRGLSSSVLKIIAIVTMLVDHTGVVMLGPDPSVMRAIGRIAFPLFAFMIAEGAKYTSDIKKYALRLLIFAFISEIPFDIAFNSGFFDLSGQNVYFTLFSGLISIILLRYLKDKKLGFLSVISTLILACCAMFLSSDYGFTGVVLITLFYAFNDAPAVSRFAVYVLCTLGTMIVILPRLPFIFIAQAQIFAVAAVIPIMLYNGQKGFKINKYFFYAFYPGHIIILALIKLLIG